MATFFWIVAALAVFNAVRLIRNKAKKADTQARLNYERHIVDEQRRKAFGCGERAGHRRAAEHEWGRK